MSLQLVLGAYSFKLFSSSRRVPGVMPPISEQLPKLRQTRPQHGLSSAHNKQLERIKLHPIHRMNMRFTTSGGS
jgi:hypothetical protein